MAGTITIERHVSVEDRAAPAPVAANPAALGLAGSAMTTFELSMVNANA